MFLVLFISSQTVCLSPFSGHHWKLILIKPLNSETAHTLIQDVFFFLVLFKDISPLSEGRSDLGYQPPSLLQFLFVDCSLAWTAWKQWECPLPLLKETDELIGTTQNWGDIYSLQPKTSNPGAFPWRQFCVGVSEIKHSEQLAASTKTKIWQRARCPSTGETRDKQWHMLAREQADLLERN